MTIPRWLISLYLFLAFYLQALVWELVRWWPLGYWPPITILGDLSPDLSATWSVGGNLVTDHRSPLLATVPRPLCHLVHVSPCEWSTWFSDADVIDYRWPIGSKTFRKDVAPAILLHHRPSYNLDTSKMTEKVSNPYTSLARNKILWKV